MFATQHYFANAVGAVDFVPKACVYLHWTGAPMSSAELRALYVHTRNLLQRHELCCLLADHRAMPAALTPADQNWLLTQWLPQTLTETKQLRYAALPTTDPTHRLHTEPVVRELRRYATVSLFSDLDQAAAWLRLPSNLASA